jgi:hypothetical protein
MAKMLGDERPSHWTSGSRRSQVNEKHGERRRYTAVKPKFFYLKLSGSCFWGYHLKKRLLEAS